MPQELHACATFSHVIRVQRVVASGSPQMNIALPGEAAAEEMLHPMPAAIRSSRIAAGDQLDTIIARQAGASLRPRGFVQASTVE